jgi:hypothetical protein
VYTHTYYIPDGVSVYLMGEGVTSGIWSDKSTGTVVVATPCKMRTSIPATPLTPSPGSCRSAGSAAQRSKRQVKLLEVYMLAARWYLLSALCSLLSALCSALWELTAQLELFSDSANSLALSVRTSLTRAKARVCWECHLQDLQIQDLVGSLEIEIWSAAKIPDEMRNTETPCASNVATLYQSANNDANQ